MPHEAYTLEQIVAAFWSKTQKGDGCWIWQGSISGERYGQFLFNGRKVKAHRFSFFLANGYWPTKEIDHTCHEKLCQRPDHLRDVTHKENMNSRRCSMICKRGHPLEDPNLYHYNTVKWGPRRRCLACLNINKKIAEEKRATAKFKLG